MKSPSVQKFKDEVPGNEKIKNVVFQGAEVLQALNVDVDVSLTEVYLREVLFDESSEVARLAGAVTVFLKSRRQCLAGGGKGIDDESFETLHLRSAAEVQRRRVAQSLNATNRIQTDGCCSYLVRTVQMTDLHRIHPDLANQVERRVDQQGDGR